MLFLRRTGGWRLNSLISMLWSSSEGCWTLLLLHHQAKPKYWLIFSAASSNRVHLKGIRAYWLKRWVVNCWFFTVPRLFWKKFSHDATTNLNRFYSYNVKFLNPTLNLVGLYQSQSISFWIYSHRFFSSNILYKQPFEVDWSTLYQPFSINS